MARILAVLALMASPAFADTVITTIETDSTGTATSVTTITGDSEATRIIADPFAPRNLPVTIGSDVLGVGPLPPTDWCVMPMGNLVTC